MQMAEDQVKNRLITQGQNMFHIEIRTDSPAVSEKILQGDLISGADFFRVGNDFFATFEVFKGSDIAEREVEFFPVEDLIDDDIMSFAPEMRQHGAKIFRVFEEVAEQDDQCSFAEFFGELVQGVAEAALVGGLPIGQRVAQQAEMFRTATWRHQHATFIVKQSQPGMILTMNNDIGQASGATAGKLVFAEVFAGIRH